MTSVSATLARLPLFQGLTPDELRVLKNFLRSRRLQPGETLFAEGAPARSCFVVIAGAIGVYKTLAGGTREQLAVLEPGALVGHMALIDQKPRSAACAAEAEPTTLIELQRSEFDRLFSANSPFAFKILDRIANDLVERLRATTQRLTEAHQGQTRADVRAGARRAAQTSVGFDTRGVELADIDLDAITYEIPDMSRRMHARR